MKNISVEQLRRMLLFVGDAVIESKPYLTEVDSKIGDGDHGIGMEIGFLKVKSVIGEKAYTGVVELFRETGMAMLNSMGGASGVIFSSIFLGGMKGAANGDSVDAAYLSAWFLRSLEAIKKRGGASVGDKTMVDAFEPACKAMEEAAAEGCDLNVLFAKAQEAAFAGMESTKDMVAKFGRAKSLMERAIGFQDAGATSVYIIFKAMARWVRENDAE